MSGAKIWCVQVAAAFNNELLANLSELQSPQKIETLGGDFYIYTFATEIEPGFWQDMPLVRYAFPVEHRWPVSTNADDFIERASQGLFTKFSKSGVVNVQTFSIEQGLKDRAKNLRGRLLQVFEKTLEANSENTFKNWRQTPISAPFDKPSLVVVLRAKEVFAGCVTPQNSGSHFAGGRRFVTQEVSRAGAKFVEASELLLLTGRQLPATAVVLELGAAPGGMTMQIAKLGYNVIAVDRAVLAPEVLKLKNVKFIKTDAAALQLNERVDLIVCDLNGSFEASMQTVVQAARYLKKGGFVFFTLKLGTEEGHALEVCDDASGFFAENQLDVIAAKHLFHNRHELTLIAERVG